MSGLDIGGRLFLRSMGWKEYITGSERLLFRTRVAARLHTVYSRESMEESAGVLCAGQGAGRKAGAPDEGRTKDRCAAWIAGRGTDERGKSANIYGGRTGRDACRGAGAGRVNCQCPAFREERRAGLPTRLSCIIGRNLSFSQPRARLRLFFSHWQIPGIHCTEDCCMAAFLKSSKEVTVWQTGFCLGRQTIRLVSGRPFAYTRKRFSIAAGIRTASRICGSTPASVPSAL
jgi:hypothetical protein